MYTQDDNDDDDEDDEEEDDDDDEDHLDDEESTDRRMSRFREACRVALQYDSQGYTTSSGSAGVRSVQELTAMSWATFCTDLEPNEADFSLRVQALDSESLKDRLRMGELLLRRQSNLLKQTLKNQSEIGTEEPEDEDDEDDDSISFN